MVQASSALGCQRADADILALHQACTEHRLNPRSILNETTRFWLAVHARVTSNRSNGDLGDLFDVPENHIHAALVHRTLPMILSFFTPSCFILMIQYAGLETNESEEYNLFVED